MLLCCGVQLNCSRQHMLHGAALSFHTSTYCSVLYCTAHTVLCVLPLFVLQVVMLYTVGIIAALLSFQAVPASLPWLQWANVFMIGFFL